jgi:hypothetical protein
MLFVYFDESKNNPENPYYFLIGVCIPEYKLLSLEKLMNDFSEKVFGTAAPSRDNEFHAIDIFHGKKNLKRLKLPPNERIDILKGLFLIYKLCELEYIEVKINCGSLSDDRNPNGLAFNFFTERVSMYSGKKSMCMLIGDRENDRVSNMIGEKIGHYKQYGTDYYFGMPVPNIVDTVHFTHSHLSRMLQMADLLAWTIQFMAKKENSTKIGMNKDYYDFVRSLNLFPAKYKVWPPEK